MEENVLFKNSQNPSQSPTQPVSQPVQPQAMPETPAAAPPKAPPPIEKHGIVGKILKITIVLLIVGIIAFLVFRFVVPFFTGNSSSGKVELTYWGLWESDASMKTLIDDFEKENPNISIKYEKRDLDKYRQTLQTRINNGDGPDVFLFHNTWTPVISSYLAPASTEVMSPEEFTKVYYPVIQKDLVRNGAIYGIPMGFDTLAMFVNDSIFEETGAQVPKTWEDFTNAATGITVKDEDGNFRTYGAGFGGYDNINRAPDILSMLFLQNRVDFKKPGDSVQQMEEALRFYTDFVTGEDNIEPVWENGAPSALVAFAGGNLGIYFGYSWDVFAIKELNPELKFSIYPVPKLAEDKTVASYWANGVSSKGKHPKESQKFLAYLAKKETQDKLYTEGSKQRLFGLPPARRDMAANVKDNPLVYPFVAQGETADSAYFVSDTFDEGLNEQMNSYLANAVRSVIGNTSVQSATQTLIEGMNQILDQYGIK